MKKLETPSDTVFEKELKEILSCDADQASEDESQSPEIRPRITFPESSDTKTRKTNFFLSEIFIRIMATIAALALLAYFISNVYSKLR